MLDGNTAVQSSFRHRICVRALFVSSSGYILAAIQKIDVVSKDKRLLIIAVHCITNVSAESGVLEKGHHQLETLYAASH